MDRRRFLKLAGAALPGLAASRSLAHRPGQANSGVRSGRAPHLPPFGSDPDPGMRPAPVTRRLLVITFNPRLPGQGNVTLREYFRWQDPEWLVATHIRDLNFASYGYLNYVVVENILVDDIARWPVKIDGFRYDEHSYLEAWRNRSFHVPDDVNYGSLMDEFRILERVRSGEVDEVWHIGPPYDGKYESTMGGPGASFSNSPPLGGTDHAGRRFIIMGYNYERTENEMMHSFGHRAESHLTTVHSRFSDQDNLWKRFTRYDLTHPGQAEMGNIHYPPNAVRDYDVRSSHVVLSNCDDWYHFPYLTGNRFRPINNEEWLGGHGRLFYMWWMRHLPHVAGECDGVALNWWRYIADPNTI